MRSGSTPAPKEGWPSRGRPAERLNRSHSPVEVTGRAVCEARTCFGSKLFVFSLLIVNDHEMLGAGQPGHPFPHFLAFPTLWDNEINVGCQSKIITLYKVEMQISCDIPE